MHVSHLRRLLLGSLLLCGVAANVHAQQAAAPVEETYAQQMAREQREHPTLKIGSPAPDFSLKGIDDNLHTLAEYADAPILAIAFISNHCPASQLYEGRIKQIVRDYADKGVTLETASLVELKKLRANPTEYWRK
jgi:hypothetical protein